MMARLRQIAGTLEDSAREFIERDFGESGVRCQFFQDGYWQPGRAWSIGRHGVSGRCRDYESGGRMPLETHGNWPLDQVRGLEKHLGPQQRVDPNKAARDRQLVALKAASPHRARAGAAVVAQADAGHLPLFSAALEPTLF